MAEEIKNYEELELGKKYEVGTILVPCSAVLEVTPTIDGCNQCYYKHKDCDGINCEGVIYKQIN